SRIARNAWTSSGGIFDYDRRKERLAEVELELAESSVWDKPERAQALGRERAELARVVNSIAELERSFDDLDGLIELAREENDQGLRDDALKHLEEAEGRLEKLEFRRMFSGAMDPNNA